MLLLPMVTSALVASAVGAHRKMLDGGDDVFGVDGSARSRHDRSLLGSSDLAALEAGSGTHFALYIIIPFVSAIVGYVTNVVALKMTFYPLEFTPAPLKFAQPKGQPFGLLGGWQGIIPAKAGKMAAILCDLMTSKLLDVKEMFGKIHPQRFAEALAPEMAPAMHRIIEDVARKEAPEFWEGLPVYVQAELVKQAMAGAPEFLADVIEDLQNHVYEVLDLKAMVVKLCEANKQDVVRMFQEVGESEFRIIENSGAYFGFLFGVVQMCVFYVVDTLEKSYSGPMLPAFGFITGYLTNWVALKLIFRPIHPTPVLCGLVVLQGAFLRRQKEVSEKFSKLNKELFCNAKNLWEEMMHGRLREEFGELVMRNTRHFTDVTLGPAKPVATLVLGPEAYGRMREHVAEQLVRELPKCVPCSYAYQDDALEVLSRAMAAAPKDADVISLFGRDRAMHPGKQIDNDMLVKPKCWFTTVAYLLFPEGARKLLADIPIDMPVDDFFCVRTNEAVVNGYRLKDQFDIVFHRPTADGDIVYSYFDDQWR